MPWFFYSILTSLSFAGMFLSVRKLTDIGFSSKQILLFLCGFAFLGFIALNIIFPSHVWQSDKFLFFLLTVAMAGLFSVLGNWTNFEAIKRSPNPGYPLGISTITILTTALLSVLIFNSPFDLFKILGTILVIIGITLIAVEKKDYLTEKTRQSHWQLFAFIALFCFTVTILTLKQTISIIGIAPKEINLFIFGFNFLAFALFSGKELKDYFTDKVRLKTFLPLVLIASIFSFLGNFFNITGLGLAPNPGYNEAIKNTNVLFVTLFSTLLFSASFDKYKFLGIITIIFGVIILVI